MDNECFNNQNVTMESHEHEFTKHEGGISLFMTLVISSIGAV